MEIPGNIRNVGLLAHTNQGRRTMIKSLLATTPQDPPPAVSLEYKSTKVNIIVDCIESATIDGAVVLVDCIDGFTAQIGALLQQVVAENVRPVLCITKLDKFILDLGLDGETAYQRLRKIIEDANVLLAPYEDHPVGGDDVRFYPEKGTVVFSSGLHSWGFTLSDFARLYSSKFGVDKTKMIERLWGENYFESATRKWSGRKTTSPTCKRGFVEFCYEPIGQLIKASLVDDDEKLRLWDMLARLGVQVAQEDKLLKGQELMKVVMKCWLPIGEALLRMVVDELPSPVESQQSRVQHLYDRALNDPYAEAIRNCDPSGSIVIAYLSTSLRGTTHHFKKRYGFARVFSGALVAGMKVRLVSPHRGEEDEEREGAFGYRVKRIATWKGDQLHFVTEVMSGNVAAIYLDSDQLVSGHTLVANNDKKKGVGGLLLHDHQPHPMRSEKFSMQLKVYDAVVAEASYQETIQKKSSPVIIQHRDRVLSVTARPLAENVTEAIETGKPKKWIKIVGDELGWDPKASHSRIWSSGTNLLIDMAQGGLSGDFKKTLKVAFQQATQNGALAGKTVRGVCFEVKEEKSAGYDAFTSFEGPPPRLEHLLREAQLRAYPCLLEQIYQFEIQAQITCLSQVYNKIYQQRGWVIQEDEEEDSIFYTVRGYIPMVDSFHISKLVAEATSGSGRTRLKFDHWEQVCSDPMEEDSQASYIAKSIREGKA